MGGKSFALGIGTQKGGTTSFYAAVSRHPELEVPKRKKRVPLFLTGRSPTTSAGTAVDGLEAVYQPLLGKITCCSISHRGTWFRERCLSAFSLMRGVLLWDLCHVPRASRGAHA